MSEPHDETPETSSDDEGVEIPVDVEGQSNETPADREASGGTDVSDEGETASSDDKEETSSDEAEATPDPSGDDADDDAETASVEEAEDLFVSPDATDVEVVEEETELDDVSELEEVSEVSDDREGPDRDELVARIDTLESTVERLKDERDDFKERMLRAAADLENYRKRAEQEKKELEKYGAKSLVKDLLSTIDNLERAVEHADTSEEANILDGVNMVLNQIHDTFEKHGIEVFDAEGEPFDPELHEAIQQVETPDHESGTVVEQFQRGYTIHDRLLRPAMVAVAKKVEDDASETGEAADGGESDTRDGGESEAEVAEGDDGSETPESN